MTSPQPLRCPVCQQTFDVAARDVRIVFHGDTLCPNAFVHERCGGTDTACGCPDGTCRDIATPEDWGMSTDVLLALGREQEEEEDGGAGEESDEQRYAAWQQEYLAANEVIKEQGLCTICMEPITADQQRLGAVNVTHDGEPCGFRAHGACLRLRDDETNEPFGCRCLLGPAVAGTQILTQREKAFVHASKWAEKEVVHASAFGARFGSCFICGATIARGDMVFRMAHNETPCGYTAHEGCLRPQRDSLDRLDRQCGCGQQIPAREWA